MNLLIIGLNYKKAPVELREKFAFSKEDLPQALEKLLQTRGVLEAVILSTCNRTELYLVVDQRHRGEQYSRLFLEEWSGVPKANFADLLYVLQEEEVVKHLFRVTCGLDSMVLGETQILGQVKESFFLAQEAEVTGTLFNYLFKQAITLGKRMHAQTALGEHAVSTSYAAIELIKRVYGSLEDKCVAVVGAGEMADLALKHLSSQGAQRFLLLNRTFERADELAQRFGGLALPWEEMDKALLEADIVVSSTGSPGFIFNRGEVEPLIAQRRTRPLLLMDMAVPRDMDPQIHQLENVYLYDIDDLESIVTANLQDRAREAQRVELEVGKEVDAFFHWLKTLGVTPLISALREKGLHIQRETMSSIEKKLPHLSERELKVLRKHTMSIVNQLMRDPVQRLKEMAGQPGADQALDLFVNLFALEEILLEKELQEEPLLQQQEVERQWGKTKAAAFNLESPSSLKA